VKPNEVAGKLASFGRLLYFVSTIKIAVLANSIAVEDDLPPVAVPFISQEVRLQC